MTFNTKLNIGDTVWHISTREGCIKETTISGVTIVHKPSNYYQGECETKIIYESSDHHNFAEESEGHYWWATRRGIIDYLTKTLKSVGDGKKSNPVAAPRKFNNLSEEFAEFFNDNLPKPPREHFKRQFPTYAANQELHKVFDEVFNPKQTPPPVEDFKIVIPPNVAKKIQEVSKRIAKKTNCDCGLHRKSELAKRFGKRLNGREKTLTDYADEL